MNSSGQVVGVSQTSSTDAYGYPLSHAFRTAPNSSINPATDDLQPVLDEHVRIVIQVKRILRFVFIEVCHHLVQERLRSEQLEHLCVQSLIC